MLYKSNYYSRHHHFKMVSFSSAGSGTSLQCCTCSTSTYTQSVYEVKTLWGHLIVMCGNESCTTQPAFLTGQTKKEQALRTGSEKVDLSGEWRDLFPTVELSTTSAYITQDNHLIVTRLTFFFFCWRLLSSSRSKQPR